ncbi:MAG TPA: M14 metallopeptidase family protein [Acidobacteriaceae bacterium]|nr:M14 metallopeptidase family protein [Acidobacteriaceae bacterium]
MHRSNVLKLGLLVGCLGGMIAMGKAQVPTPVSVLGHTPGDDFYLADYEDAVRYFHAAAAATDRMKMFTVGKTTEGREIEVGVISSPANLARLDEYKKNARRLAVADNLTDEQARQLAHDSKVIVHIDGGLHSNEVAGGQHSIMLAYKLLSAKNDPEVDAILDNVILVLWPTLNPDGQDMVVHWYRQNVGTKYEVAPMPWLFQDYVGHDNNRDGYMLNMKESQVLAKAEIEWSPEIFYCQHQTAPFPARIWIPPFADPISSNISPYVRSWLNVVGTNMTAYLDAHQMPGAISETRFDNWYAGFNDWVHVFRNEISFFTETGLYAYATPRFYTVNEFPKETQDLRALSMYSEPWEGGWWRLGDAVNYMIGGSMSVLDLAAKNHETLLFNRYQAARDNIAHYKKEGPFAYVISDKQADTPEAGLLAQKMIENGLKVYATKTGFVANGVTYPVGSWVIPMDQPFSGLVKELFERQRYPDEIELGTSKAVDLPYDVTGWTLPLQMGVAVDTVSDPLTTQQLGLMEPVEEAKAPAVEIAGGGDVFVISRKPNASYAVVNEVLKQGGSVAMSKDAIATPEGKERGAFVIRGLGRGAMDGVAKKYGVSVGALTAEPANVIAIKKVRVGLYRPWAPSIDEGWTRWILENYGFEPKSIYNADMRSSDLHARYDVIVLPDMSRDQLMEGFHVGMVPGQYAGGIGPDGVDNLRAFVREGGMLVASNRTAANLIPLMSLPVKDALEGVKSDKFFCSGALLRLEQANGELPVNFGVPEAPVVMFQRGPAFVPEAGFKGAVLAKYAKGTNPLESGLLLHPEAIEDKAAAVELEYGKGRIVLYGFKPEFRGQAHGTYRYLFNALYSFDQPELPLVKVPAAAKDVITTVKATVEEPDEY